MDGMGYASGRDGGTMKGRSNATPAVEAAMSVPTAHENGSRARRGHRQGHPATTELTPLLRDRLLRSVVSSQALEGVHVTHDVASELLDDVLRERLPDIG